MQPRVLLRPPLSPERVPCCIGFFFRCNVKINEWRSFFKPHLRCHLLPECFLGSQLCPQSKQDFSPVQPTANGWVSGAMSHCSPGTVPRGLLCFPWVCAGTGPPLPVPCGGQAGQHLGARVRVDSALPLPSPVTEALGRAWETLEHIQTDEVRSRGMGSRAPEGCLSLSVTSAVVNVACPREPQQDLAAVCCGNPGGQGCPFQSPQCGLGLGAASCSVGLLRLEGAPSSNSSGEEGPRAGRKPSRTGQRNQGISPKPGAAVDPRGPGCPLVQGPCLCREHRRPRREGRPGAQDVYPEQGKGGWR